MLDEGIKTNAIRPCQCSNPLCTTHMIDPPYPQRLEQERAEALRQAADALSLLGVQLPQPVSANELFGGPSGIAADGDRRQNDRLGRVPAS